MTVLNDGVVVSLQGFAGTSNDKLGAWLRSQITVPPPVPTALNDLWALYLNQLGIAGGTTDERIRKFMIDRLGGIYPGISTYNDVQNAFWNSGVAPTQPDDATYFIDRVIAPWACTRPSSATDISLTDVYSSVGNNLPYYNRNLGLFAEYNRTNEQANSTNFAAGTYAQVNIIVTPAATNSPAGTNTASKLAATVANDNHFLAPLGFSATANTLSFFAKAGEYTTVGVEANGAPYQVAFDLVGGTVIGNDFLNVGRITSAGGGWWRCAVSYGAGGNNPFIRLLDPATGNVVFPGDGVSGIYLWGVQLEFQRYPSTYIPTSGVVATRQRNYYSRASIPGFTGNNFTIRIPINSLKAWNVVKVPPENTNGVVWAIQTAADSRMAIEIVDGSDVIKFVRNNGAANLAEVATTSGSINYLAGTELDIEIQHSTTNGISISVNGTQYTNNSAAAKSAWVQAIPTHTLGNLLPTLDSSAVALIQAFQYWNSVIPLIL